MRTLTRVAASAGALALVTGVIELLKGHVPVLSLAVLYLLAIIPVAVAWGIVYAVGVAIGSMLAFNFFFLPPIYTLTIQDHRNRRERTREPIASARRGGRSSPARATGTDGGT